MTKNLLAGPIIVLAAAAVGPGPFLAPPADAQEPVAPMQGGTLLPTGMRVTPEAMPGAGFEALNPNLPELPDFTAGQASALALSPDGETLLVLTSGYNRNFGPDGAFIEALSSEYVFVYDVAGPLPVKRQVLRVPNTFAGIAWHPDGGRFFVTGGVDDNVYDYAADGDGRFDLAATIALGHSAGVGIDVEPEAAGVAVAPDGKRLLVANYQNESVSLIDAATGEVLDEVDLRPGRIDAAESGTPGGTYPNAVAWAGDAKAYVTSQRDRELIVLAAAGRGLDVTGRIATNGQPAAMIANAARSRLYVALDNTDTVLVLDTASDEVVEEIAAAAPREVWRNPAGLHGANTNGLALSPDERTLFATNGGLNAVAVVRLGEEAVDAAVAGRAVADGDAEDGDGDEAAAGLDEDSRVIGLLPTGWYPTAVAVRPDGKRLYVVNGKSNAGPNPLGCRDNPRVDDAAANACKNADQYVWQLEKAGLLTLPMPGPQQMAELTWQVAFNNDFPSVAAHDSNNETMAVVTSKIDHVIYVVKENRTYDQVLGDLDVGNGDPDLVLLPDPISPNHHALARDFVTLDAFFDSGESSNTGWNWTTAARTTDFTERTSPVNYADRSLQYDWEGVNRGVNVALPTLDQRTAANPAMPQDPDMLAGTADVAAPDGPGAGLVGTGYLWDVALRQGLTVRNYGFYGDGSRYDAGHSAHLPPTLRDPHAEGVQVFFPAKASLAPHSDIHFRGYDMSFPDYWRLIEWEREFDGYVAAGELPNLTLLRMPHDHFGNFEEATDGVNTVETQMADNDYAIGRIVEKVAASPFADSTLVFIIEDDAQNGADHVDPHRSLGYVVGPYVKQGAVVSDHYTTVNMLRTIEAVLDLPPLGLNDGLAEPMAEVFDPDQTAWTYAARVPEVLRTTELPSPPAATKKAGLDDGCFTRPVRSAAYWKAAMADQNFLEEDRLDTERFNEALWRGIKGEDAPRLEAFREAHGCP